jgi:hypothetical protein
VTLKKFSGFVHEGLIGGRHNPVVLKKESISQVSPSQPVQQQLQMDLRENERMWHRDSTKAKFRAGRQERPC